MITSYTYLQKCGKIKKKIFFSFFLEFFKKGGLFVYPTDTLLGLGGMKTKNIAKTIFDLKKRDPSKNLSFFEKKKTFLNKLSSKERKIFFKFKNKKVTFILFSDAIRIPKSFFCKFLSTFSPFFSTSCNISTKKNIHVLKDLDSCFLNSWVLWRDVPYENKPSDLIFLKTGKIKTRL